MEKKPCCRHHRIHGGSCGTAVAARGFEVRRRTALQCKYRAQRPWRPRRPAIFLLKMRQSANLPLARKSSHSVLDYAPFRALVSTICCFAIMKNKNGPLVKFLGNLGEWTVFVKNTPQMSPNYNVLTKVGDHSISAK